MRAPFTSPAGAAALLCLCATAAGCPTAASLMPQPPADRDDGTLAGGVPLLRPADPASILGHAVQTGRDSFVVAEPQLREGCLLNIRRVDSHYMINHESGFSLAGDVGLNFVKFALDGRMKYVNRVQYQITSAGVLEADASKDCGEKVVTRVHLGTGAVTFAREVEGGAGVSIPLFVQARTEGQRQVISRVVWDREQAYAFELSDRAAAGAPARLDVSFSIPRALREGEALTIRVDSNRKAYILLVSVTAAGEAYVLLPNRFVQLPSTEPGFPLVFPSPEVAAMGYRLKARLPEGTQSSAETLVAIALEDRAAYETIAGAEFLTKPFTVLTGDEFSRKVEAHLRGLPPGTYARVVQSYEIHR